MSERGSMDSSDEEKEEEEDEDWETAEEDEQETVMTPGETEINIASSVQRYMMTREVSPVKAITSLDPSLEHVASELKDVVQSSSRSLQQNIISMNVQQHVNMKGSANMTFGGTQHVEKKEASAVDGIMSRTVARLASWTNGMVETSAFKKVMKKLDDGATWVTIKGCPGEGKTTTAYMVLNELHKAGRKIFDVTTPEEFSIVVNSGQENPVIMLDDIFGNLEFDKSEWSRWKSTLLKSLEEKDRQTQNDDKLSDEACPDKQEITKEEITVILVGREYVLNVCISDLGKLADFFTHAKHVVNMSTAGQRQVDEKVRIWKTISAASGIELDDDTIQKICGIDLPHGFPHVCKLFVTLRKQNDQLSAVAFFGKPLQFLNETIHHLIYNDQKCSLFKIMLQHGGKITARNFEEMDDPQMIRAARELVGTYLKKEDDCFMFDHPSVYDSVAFNLCEFGTLFVIQNCEISFIHERIRLQVKTEKREKTEFNLVYTIPRVWIQELAKRFAAGITEGSLAQYLSHQAFADKEFVEKTMSLVHLGDLVNKNDRLSHEVLIHLSSNGSPELLKYIERQPDFKLTYEDFIWILYGACLYSATEVLSYMVQKVTVDINALTLKPSMPHNSSNLAMLAAAGRNKTFVGVIMTLNPDVHYRNTNGESLLHILVENGLADAVEDAITLGADVNMRDRRLFTPLMCACEENNEGIVRILIEKGADPNITDRGGSTPLICACKSGYEKIVQILVKKGADTNAKGRHTPLIFALQKGHVSIVKCLIENGAGINCMDSCDSYPLIYACKANHFGITRLLLDKGADVNIKDRGGSPLLYACKEQNQKIVKLLIEAGSRLGDEEFYMACQTGCVALVEVFHQNGYKIPKTHAGPSPMEAAVSSCNAEMVKYLIRNGASVNSQDTYKYIPIHQACTQDASDIVKVLLDHGADVNAKDVCGNSPLHLASSDKCFGILLEFGPDISIKNSNRDSILHRAASKGFSRSVCALIRKKLDLEAQNSRKETPLSCAVQCGFSDCVKMLIQAGANVNCHTRNNPLFCASHSGFTDCVKLLIDAGADLCVKSQDGDTPFLSAVRKGHNACVKLLIDAGADLCVKSQDGDTPFLSAVRKGHNACVKLLIDAGADVNFMSRNGDTVLHIAVASHNDDCVRLLIKSGTNVNAVNRDNCSVLSHALKSQSSATTVDILIKANANVSETFKDDSTLLHLAICNNTFSAVPVLLEAGANVQFTNIEGQTPLHLAVRQSSNDGSRLRAIKTMITKGANVNSRDTQGNVPLHWLYPATLEDFEIAKLLTEHGADVNIRNISNQMAPIPRHKSQFHYSTQCVSWSVLLEKLKSYECK